MKILILALIFISTNSFCQNARIKENGLGIYNDTLTFENFIGINYDTSFYNIDIDRPNKLMKMELSPRFKADSFLIKRIEKKIFDTYIDCNPSHIASNFHNRDSSIKYYKNNLDSMKQNFQKIHSQYDRRYFGYYNSKGEQIVIIKFIPKGKIQVIPLGHPKFTYETSPTLSYNVTKGCLSLTEI